jgi:hypothetical protein
MQTITKQYKVYTFEELSKEAQDKVIEKHWDWNVNSWNDNGWAEYLLEQQKESLLSNGFTDAEIYFSGFASQGDGASFTSQVNISRWLKAHKLTNKFRALYNADQGTARRQGMVRASIVKTSHQYEHENTMGITCEYDGNDEKVSIQLDQFTDLVIENAKHFARMIYKALESEYDYLTSRDAITESLSINDYTFLQDGTMFNE